MPPGRPTRTWGPVSVSPDLPDAPVMPEPPHHGGPAEPPLFTVPFALVTAATLGYFMALGLLITTLPRYIKGPLHGDSTGVGLALGAFSVAAVLCRPLA